MKIFIYFLIYLYFLHFCYHFTFFNKLKCIDFISNQSLNVHLFTTQLLKLHNKSIQLIVKQPIQKKYKKYYIKNIFFMSKKYYQFKLFLFHQYEKLVFILL